MSTAAPYAGGSRRFPEFPAPGGHHPSGRTALGAAGLVLLLPMSPGRMSVQIAVNGLVAFTWTTVVAPRPRRCA
ncbi:hypothetical protein [Streptosporangium sandarakinum]|uniref:hypothetical protein n=1 Tax=Streptosporangium sandarakinum TaxID=1260955 RepID=UPI0033BF3524